MLTLTVAAFRTLTDDDQTRVVDWTITDDLWQLELFSVIVLNEGGRDLRVGYWHCNEPEDMGDPPTIKSMRFKDVVASVPFPIDVFERLGAVAPHGGWVIDPDPQLPDGLYGFGWPTPLPAT